MPYRKTNMKPSVKLGTIIKAMNPEKMPELDNLQGTIVCYYKCPGKILYGTAFETWNNGHGLRLAAPNAAPTHLSFLIGKTNCWWLEKHELKVLYKSY